LEAGGGSLLAEAVDGLQVDVANYLGMLNQLAAGLRLAPEERYEMPPELRKYYQMQETGLAIWEGGLDDQPHIWLQMLGVLSSTVKTFEALRDQQNANNQSPLRDK
jgi:hypothetical protein